MVLAAEDTTQHFPFAGTQWLLPTAAGGHTLVLQADGSVATFGGASRPGAVQGAQRGRAGARIRDAHRQGAGTGSNAFIYSASEHPDTLLGHWRVHHGVLQMALSDGAHYTLTLQGGFNTLAGVARRVEAVQTDGQASEWQWPAHLRRAGAPAPQALHHLQQAQAARKGLA